MTTSTNYRYHVPPAELERRHSRRVRLYRFLMWGLLGTATLYLLAQSIRFYMLGAA